LGVCYNICKVALNRDREIFEDLTTVYKNCSAIWVACLTDTNLSVLANAIWDLMTKDNIIFRDYFPYSSNEKACGAINNLFKQKHPGKSWPLYFDNGSGVGSFYSGWSDLLVSAMQQLGYNTVSITRTIAYYIGKYYNIQEIVQSLDGVPPTVAQALTPEQQKAFSEIQQELRKAGVDPNKLKPATFTLNWINQKKNSRCYLYFP